MPKPICVPCHRFFRMKKQGFCFTEGMPHGRDVKPGLAEPEKWKPYKVWVGDRWECEGCGAAIVTGFAREHIAEHYQKDFSEIVKQLGADQFQVNDC